MIMMTSVLIGIVAFLHVFFLILEMFLWEKPFGRKIFGMTKDAAATTAVLAKNQGLYNGFLAAGLIWSFFIQDIHFQQQLRIFFLTCIIIAGIFGAMTAKTSIIFTQALPAFLALVCVYLTYVYP